MRVTTWNINSVRAHLPVLLDFLRIQNPDVVLLQEIKCEESQFPFESIEDLGYNIALSGQKGRAGVATLSKFPIEEVQKTFEGLDELDARYIEVFTQGIRISNVYVPNGESLKSDKYIFKLNFMKQLHAHLKKILSDGDIFFIGGDFNVAIRDDDTYDPDIWKDCICVSDPERQHFNAFLNLGLTDAFLIKEHDPTFTFWSYRANAFNLNKGLRLDYFLLSPEALRLHVQTCVEPTWRGMDSPSDHAPLTMQLSGKFA